MEYICSSDYSLEHDSNIYPCNLQKLRKDEFGQLKGKFK